MTEAASAAMAAAIAAADELAKNGGIALYSSGSHYVDAEGSSLSLAEGGVDSPATNREGSDQEEDAEKRLARSRERNREHARRTRRRKKAQLEALQSKVKGLEAERRVLKQRVEECSIASILVGLSSGSNPNSTTQSLLEVETSEEVSSKVAMLVTGTKRKRFVADDAIESTTQPLKLSIEGRTTLIGGGKTHINWKTGVYSDENGMQTQLTQDQLESLRRERNRMHAKMTRDRKKCFIATIEKTIEELEAENQRMRDALAKVAHVKHAGLAPVHSPANDSAEPSLDPEDNFSVDTSSDTNQHAQISKNNSTEECEDGVKPFGVCVND